MKRMDEIEAAGRKTKKTTHIAATKMTTRTARKARTRKNTLSAASARAEASARRKRLLLIALRIRVMRLPTRKRPPSAHIRHGAPARPRHCTQKKLVDYRARLLRSHMKHSKTLGRANLDIVARDPAAFAEVEKTVYADSILASSSADSVPAGSLRPIVKRLPSGHTQITWVGQPQAWMDRFAPPSRRFLTRINTKWSGNPE